MKNVWFILVLVFGVCGAGFGTESRVLVIRSVADQVLKPEDEADFQKDESDLRRMVRTVGAGTSVERMYVRDFEKLDSEIGDNLSAGPRVSVLVFQGHGNEVEYVPSKAQWFVAQNFAQPLLQLLERLGDRLSPEVLVFFPGCNIAKESSEPGFLYSIAQILNATRPPKLSRLQVLGQMDLAYFGNLLSSDATPLLMDPSSIPVYRRWGSMGPFVPLRVGIVGAPLLMIPLLVHKMFPQGVNGVGALATVGLSSFGYFALSWYLRGLALQNDRAVRAVELRELDKEHHVRLIEVGDSPTTHEAVDVAVLAGFLRDGAVGAVSCAEFFALRKIAPNFGPKP